MNRRLLHLDVVRGLAILLVLLFHTRFSAPRPVWYAPVQWLGGSGWAGVDLFFVLSGFLIGGILLREREQRGVIDAPRFLIRRAFKTLPTYYVFLGTFAWTYICFATKWGPSPSARRTELVRDLWPTLIHCQNYFPSTALKLGWLWSLAVEEHFYLFLALALSWLSRKQPQPGSARIPGFWWLFLGAVTGSIQARAFNPVLFNSPAGASHLRFDSLFVGVALAYVARVRHAQLDRYVRWRWVILIAGLALFLLHRVSPGDAAEFLFPFGPTVMACGGALIVLAAYLWDRSSPPSSQERGARSSHAFRRIVAWIGVRSYSIYVWHGWFSRPIANRLTHGTAIDPTLPGVQGMVGELIFVLAAIGLGTLSYWLIEDPFMKLRDRWFGRSQPSIP